MHSFTEIYRPFTHGTRWMFLKEKKKTHYEKQRHATGSPYNSSLYCWPCKVQLKYAKMLVFFHAMEQRWHRNTTYELDKHTMLSCSRRVQCLAQGHFVGNTEEIKRKSLNRKAHYSQYSDVNEVKLSEYYWLPQGPNSSWAAGYSSRRTSESSNMCQSVKLKSHENVRKIIRSSCSQAALKVLKKFFEFLWRIFLWAATSSTPDVGLLWLHLVSKT